MPARTPSASEPPSRSPPTTATRDEQRREPRRLRDDRDRDRRQPPRQQAAAEVGGAPRHRRGEREQDGERAHATSREVGTRHRERMKLVTSGVAPARRCAARPADTIRSVEPFRIGVLAVQGNFREHAAMLRSLGAEVVEVRKPEQLDGLDGLVIPGGESTTFTRLMHLYGLDEAVRSFAAPVFGTCAGMIVLDRDHLGLVDIARPAQRLRPAGRVVRDRPRRGRARASRCARSSSARRGSRRSGRTSRCSPRSTGIRCSRARDASSSPRSIRS